MNASSQIPPPTMGLVQDLAATAADPATTPATLADATRDIAAVIDWFRTRLMSVMALTAGRPDWYQIAVSDILHAYNTQQSHGRPLSVSLSGSVQLVPTEDDEGRTVLPLTTPFGASAELLLSTEERMALTAHLLTAPGEPPCPTPGCGGPDGDRDASDPALWGWTLLRVAGTDGPARWYDTPWCASAAMTAAAAELAAEDMAMTAAAGPAGPAETSVPAPAPVALSPLTPPARPPHIEDDQDDDGPAPVGGAW
ncbi:hypothetical protein [Streptomyces uncialis]|uniref:hypothetical protein n=1 Tax=Streptomyces uncialis TaxID=1048205 RepID=UPI0022584BA2|nr:hypothetical protein [Streptomyces uncialis]MCX4661471.1 hypothetical protein [Streptomyces uncialis]